LLNKILEDKNLKLIAIAGTHGKTTTTAMTTWLFKQLNIPISYVLPAKTSFADMGFYDEASEYFVYEADEFDRNFLSFAPHISLITGVSWDHHEIFKTRDDYKNAFKEFIAKSQTTYMWQEDFDYLDYQNQTDAIKVLNDDEPSINHIKLLGKYNRRDGWLACSAVAQVTNQNGEALLESISSFPGLSRRMEKIADNLYSDYATYTRKNYRSHECSQRNGRRKRTKANCCLRTTY
jgi:UDP-N-acetylmuramate--alanine ligase